MNKFFSEYSIYDLDDNETQAAFAESLKELRNYCDLSISKLSKILNIPNQTLSSYKNKLRTPSITQAIKITAYFGLTVEEFILCGFDKLPQDIAELYEARKKSI